MFLSKSLTWIQVQSIQSTFHQQWFTRWFRYRSDCSDRKGFEDRTNGGFGALCRVGTGERSFQNRTLVTPTTWWNHHSEQVCFYVGLIRLDEITLRSSRKLRFIKLKIDSFECSILCYHQKGLDLWRVFDTSQIHPSICISAQPCRAGAIPPTTPGHNPGRFRSTKRCCWEVPHWPIPMQGARPAIRYRWWLDVLHLFFLKVALW